MRLDSCYSDSIAVKQSQVDKLYASLKDLAGERRDKLDEVLKLYMLNREIEDIEQWIAEREVVAGSHELGQDFEHVTVSGLCFFDPAFSDFYMIYVIGQTKTTRSLSMQKWVPKCLLLYFAPVLTLCAVAA